MSEPVRIGFHLTPFWSPTDRAPTAIIDEAIEVVHAAAGLGFAWVSVGHHWLSLPTVWPHPIAMLSRLAPEAGEMRLKTSMLLLPLLNPVDVAESVVTLDHITHGRLDVGVAIGYRELELGVAGLLRSDRVPKLEESLDLMKRLWRGEEVVFKGRYTRVEGGRPDVARFGAMFREERAAAGAATAGYVGASRSLIVGATRHAAATAARGYLEK